MKNEDFAHLIARLRVLETKLLNPNEMERMLFAKNAQEAYKVLNELDYSSHVGDIEDVSNFQEVLNAGLQDSKDLIVHLAPHKWVFDILWLRYDFHNIKTMLKGKLSGKDFNAISDYLMKFGTIDIAKLRKYIFENENVPFLMEEDHEEKVKQSIKEAEKIFEKDNDPQLLDIYLDKSFCEISLYIANKSKHPFVLELVRKYIDLKNLEAMVRIKIAGKSEKFLEKVLMEGGDLSTKTIVAAFKKDLDEMPEFMKHSDYAKVISEGVKSFQEEKSLAKFEKASYDHITDFMQVAKRIPFGPEPIFGYFWAKKNNALVLRTIMVGKLNGFEPSEIKSKLRNLYT